jgi:peptide/nickel transport system permease protein
VPHSASDPVQAVAAAKLKVLTPGQLTWRRFLKHRAAVFGLIGMISLILFIVIGSILMPVRRANKPDPVNILQTPTPILQWASVPSKDFHPFGTDATGRDVFARIVYGGQISLVIGLLSLVLGLGIGVIVGGVAGYFGGWVDAALMAVTEALLCIPGLFLLIVLAKMFGSKIPSITLSQDYKISGSVIVVILVIGFTSWMYLARIVRANVLSLRERDYVAAAEVLGVGRLTVLFRHLVPNTFAPIIVSATLGLVGAITGEAYVSYFGLGVQDPPTASWGNMISNALSFMQRSPPVWWMWFFPGLFITLTVLFINFIGDGLRDALDPRRRV